MASGVLYAHVILKLVGFNNIEDFVHKKIVNFLHISYHNFLLEFRQL
jgi:hypothetical protein